MSIAVIAPTKFYFQDIACVELGLRWPADGGTTLRAEPKGGEDGVLEWQEHGTRRVCEIQVKGRTTGSINVRTLAEYLAHFPDRQAKGCLLDRLMADPSRVVLFVASERCNDDVARYRASTNWTGALRADDPHRPSGQALAEALRYHSERPLRARSRTLTQLELDRAASLAALARKSHGLLAEALNRVFIHEEETPATISVRLQKKLFEAGVPTDRLSDGIKRLAQALANDRVDRPNVFQKLRDVLSDLAPESFAPPKYLMRGQEKTLAQDLAREKAILLSGPPRVGKSWLARQIAGTLQNQGYEVASSGHIDQADRFLNDPIRKPRAYILDDPLGSRQAHSDATARIAELRRLLTSLEADRRLIVAQSEAPILETCRGKNLGDCPLGQFAWRAIGSLPADQAENLWRRDAADAGVLPDSIEQIADLIHKRKDLRDAGALAYLAITFDQLRPDASANEVVSQARNDAADFARMLANESASTGEVLRAVAVTTETAIGVGEPELAFVMSKSEDRPSLDQYFAAYDIRELVVKPVTPAYSNAPVVSELCREAMTTLRRRRVLDKQADRLNFVHPYLRAGAQAIFRPDLVEDTDAAVQFTERALAAVDPKVSLAAARNLDWIATALESRADGLARAVSLATIGLRSLYPATRDACFAFLTSRAAELPLSVQTQLSNWVWAVDIDFEHVQVVSGYLIVSNQGAFIPPDPVPHIDIQPYVDAIEADQPVDLHSALAYAIILSFRQNNISISPKLMDRLLSLDTAVLRAAASADWLQQAHSDNADILGRICNDAVPAVSNALLDVVATSWARLPESCQDALLSTLSAHARSPGPATTLLAGLAKFNRVEEFGENPPWKVFCNVAAIALENAPHVDFSNGRLFSAVEEGLRTNEREQFASLLKVWTERLARRLTTRLPDENELSVPELLLGAGPPGWRLPLINMLLEVPNTGARIKIVAILVSRWDGLSPHERESIIRLLKGDETDAIWLHAAALTRREVPHEVLKAITGQDDLCDLSPSDLLAVLGEPLYRACLHIFLGAPQPLWWLGTHHTQSSVWSSAVRWSASSADRPVFSLALHGLISLTVEDSSLVDLIDQYEVNNLTAVFEVFLCRKIQETANWRTPAWVRLLDRGLNHGFIDEWFERIIDAAPAILDHVRDVRQWLGGHSIHEPRLIGGLASEIEAYQRAHTIAEAITRLRSLAGSFASSGNDGDGNANESPSPDEVVTTYLECLKMVLEESPPRLHQTWSDLTTKLREIDAPEAMLEWLETQRLHTFDDSRDIRSTCCPIDEPLVLDGWMHPK